MSDLFLEWFGYAASVVVAVSLIMNSLLRLRWINLFGSAMFSTYGLLIGAMPVFILNGFIVLINIYYLYQIYSKTEFFRTLEIRQGNLYLNEFLDFYEQEIKSYLPQFNNQEHKEVENFFILRDMQVVGIFLAHRHNDETLMIDLDFAVPEYRDFKLADFIFDHQKEYLKSKSYKKLYTPSQSEKHNSYLTKIGFEKTTIDNKEYFTKNL